MADPTDLIGAMRGVAASIANQAGAGRDLLGPLTRQAEVIEQLVRRQVELEQDLVRRALAPAQATVDALDSAPAAMRAQATAFRAAAASFSQAAELLDLQAAALDQTLSAVKAPVKIAKRTATRRPKKPS